MTHLEFLSGAEKYGRPELRIMWGRSNSNTIWLSTVGWNHSAQEALVKLLFDYGCQYAFDYAKEQGKEIQHYDKQSGRTFTFLKEPNHDTV